MWMFGPGTIQILHGQLGLDGKPVNTDLERGQLLGHPVYNYPVGLPVLDDVVDDPGSRFGAIGNPMNFLLGIGNEHFSDVRSAILQDSTTGLILSNAFQADGSFLAFREQLVCRLMRPDAVAILRTAAV
jgi:hypothetical protein